MQNFYKTLKVAKHEPHILILTLNRPYASNAFNTEMAEELKTFFLTLHEYEPECRAILGAINGAAFGGGCELVAALDFSYASVEATFAQTETKIGIIPGIGGTQTLSRAVGEKRAKEIIFSAQPFTSNEALEWGLINAVFSQETLLTETINTAKKIILNAPIAVRQAKLSIQSGLQNTLSKGMSIELECYNKTIKTNDRIEGFKQLVELALTSSNSRQWCLKLH